MINAFFLPIVIIRMCHFYPLSFILNVEPQMLRANTAKVVYPSLPSSSSSLYTSVLVKIL